jgi:hypothetical protein
MADQGPVMPALAAHGASRLPAVEVANYNVELKDDEGFVGDRASKGAFRTFIENWRKPLRDLGHDPFDDEPSDVLTKKRLDALLSNGDLEAAGIVHGAIESFAQELALVTRRFQAEGVERHRTPDHRRRFQRQQGRRTRDRAGFSDPEGG